MTRDKEMYSDDSTIKKQIEQHTRSTLRHFSFRKFSHHRTIFYGIGQQMKNSEYIFLQLQSRNGNLSVSLTHHDLIFF